MKLSDRLLRISLFVTRGNILADIGTDHGYIPIYLVENGIVPYAYACDVKEGPLERAREHIRQHSLEDKIQIVKSNGLENLKENQADTILIAGMGGTLTIDILSNGINVLSSAKELIVSPHSEINLVRGYLSSIGYEIVEEDMLIDSAKYYVVMKWIKAGEKRIYSACELLYGHLLLKNRNQTLYKYLNHEKDNYEKIYNNLSAADNEETLKRREEIRGRLDIISTALEYYQ